MVVLIVVFLISLPASVSDIDAAESTSLSLGAINDLRLLLEACIPLDNVEDLNEDEVEQWLDCTLSSVYKNQSHRTYKRSGFPNGQILNKMTSQQMQKIFDIPEEISGALYTYAVRLSPQSIDWPILSNTALPSSFPPHSRYPEFKDECQIPYLHEV